LLSRLKDWNDQESWRVFFETYWRLIYHTALKAGLTDAEAQDVVQETVLCVSKSMPGFQYAEEGSFKSWLLRLTSWRINDQFRKRDPRLTRKDSSTATVEKIPDPAGTGLQAVWDEEWDRNLLEAAIERVKKKVDAKHYQLFDLYVFKHWPVTRISRALKINPGSVYLAKHRVANTIKKELNYLRAKLL
jgi:RNA polymerase sigma-70 factor (ECF subfamily)